jgi:hypothetical protein
MFPLKPERGPFDRAMSFVRARQGIVIGVIALLVFGIFSVVHNFIARRNAEQVNDVPAVALTEVSDLGQRQQADLPMPNLQFAFDGNPRTMQTFLMEPGAVAPAAPIVALPTNASNANTELPRVNVPPPSSIFQNAPLLPAPINGQSATTAPQPQTQRAIVNTPGSQPRVVEQPSTSTQQ